MTLQDLGEFGLIRHLSARLATRPGVRLGIGDDSAVLDALDSPVVTCDCLVEGVHFRRDWTSARLLGRKAVAVNVSDVAAMGGHPVAAFVTLALSPRDDLGWIEELYQGMEEAAAQWGLSLAGGDTSRSPQATMLSLTLIGNAPDPALRSGARPDDLLLVTGSLGDSAAGLALLQAGQTTLAPQAREFLLNRHFNPTPRLQEMHAALSVRAADGSRAVTAALDLSDGLCGDAAHIARASGVGVEIDAGQVPISAHCRQAATDLDLGFTSLDWALYGGEDYELLLCVAPETVAQVARAVTEATGTPVTLIGRCVARQDGAAPVMLCHPDGRREAARGAWTHF